jgi:hypothetical protein
MPMLPAPLKLLLKIPLNPEYYSIAKCTFWKSVASQRQLIATRDNYQIAHIGLSSSDGEMFLIAVLDAPEKTCWTYSDDTKVTFVPSRPYAALPNIDFSTSSTTSI